MFQSWRLKLREAEEAADHGQWDEACRLLLEGDLRQFLPGKRLSVKVAEQLAQRARRRAIHGETAGAWRDWQAARSLAGDVDAVLEARQEMVELGLGEAEGHLESGESAHALRLLEEMERYPIDGEPIRWLKEVAQRMDEARRLARRGHFGQAESQLQVAAAIRPRLDYLQNMANQYRGKIEPFRRLTQELHDAMTQEQWTVAVRLADEVLELAPENSLAQHVRRRAWAHVGAPITDSCAAVATSPGNGAARRGDAQSPLADERSLSPRTPGTRFLLWIDGVGGYFVCLGDEVLLGQAQPLQHIDVPIQADLSRRHAIIARKGDGYVIQPMHSTRVNSRSIRDTTLLSDGDEIQLGGNVRWRFRQPHALSASARLEFLSHHRTSPKSDGVLLMAESCVLGNKRQNHVVCPQWEGDVVLYRRDGDLYCRAIGPMEIDGQTCEGGGRLSLNSHISGSDFSMSLEELP